MKLLVILLIIGGLAVLYVAARIWLIKLERGDFNDDFR